MRTTRVALTTILHFYISLSAKSSVRDPAIATKASKLAAYAAPTRVNGDSEHTSLAVIRPLGKATMQALSRKRISKRRLHKK